MDRLPGRKWGIVAKLEPLRTVFQVAAGSPRTRLIALWAAAQVGLTYWLFIIEPGGPGNIFPIVMVFGAAFSAAAVAAGGGVGWLFTRLFRLIRVS
jgi:hypothetical protein